MTTRTGGPIVTDDLLERAVERLRELAEAVQVEDPDGDWYRAALIEGNSVRDVDGDIAYTFTSADAELIEVMRPAVALAIGDWLNSLTGVPANTAATIPADEDGPLSDELDHALAVARAILREDM
jgi:hypothetical protein